MSATKQQQQLAKGTSWLAQLRVNAEYAGCDASLLAQDRLNKTLDTLTLAEAQTLVWELNGILQQKAEEKEAGRTPVNGPHCHDCISCYEPVKCHKDNCREAMSEHRHCHEGFGVQEFNRTYRHSF